jgi:NMD protein affecting ribosome stability and mRNA decay
MIRGVRNGESSMTRRDRLIRERNHDVYRTGKKLPDPSACTKCQAMYRNGRWQWSPPPADAKQVLCPACHRIQDDMPAGLLTLVGAFHLEHRVEILGLVRNIEEREVKNHPLKRIIAVSEQDDTVTISTADADLARSLGNAIHHAYQGELDYHYPGEGDVLRVRWER